MKRRSFLKASGVAALSLVGRSLILTPAMLARASAATDLPLASLRANLSEDEALLLLPADTKFDAYQASFNLRTLMTPQLRVLCKTPEAVGKVIQWVTANKIPFAIRGGGHSFEGYSQSRSVVIDGRMMQSIELSDDKKMVTVGGGCTLGQIYESLSEDDLAIPGGSCPSVGIGGHALGGGFGFLARSLGLACDNLESLELIDAQGRVLTVNADNNPDLFWACRGGGNGSFGVVSKMTFRTSEIPEAVTFSVGWVVPRSQAVEVMRAWQAWAPKAPDNITSILNISKHPSGAITLHCAGQSIGSEADLKTEIAGFIKVVQPTSELNTTRRPFIEAVHHFGGDPKEAPVYMKGRSDYLFQPMSGDGMTALMTGLQKMPAGTVAVICDSYGGAIGRISNQATAFAHREGALYSMQYYSQWTKSADTSLRLQLSKSFYDSLRPFVSGASYVNYCDLDLVNWGEAYWGANFQKLKQIKSVYDPGNVFQHAQSIPPAST